MENDRGNIQPYVNKLEFPERRFYENLLHEINGLFDVDSFGDNSKLGGLYLLGFHHQAYELTSKKNKV